MLLSRLPRYSCRSQLRLLPVDAVLADRVAGGPPALHADVGAGVPALEEALFLVVEHRAAFPGPGLQAVPLVVIAQRQNRVVWVLLGLADRLHHVMPRLHVRQIKEGHPSLTHGRCPIPSSNQAVMACKRAAP